MKRSTTARGSTTNPKEMKQRWYSHWESIPQEMVQKWIEGVYNNIQEVLRLEGGNEYREGRAASQRDFKGRRVIGKLSTHSYLTSGAGEMDNQTVLNDDWVDIDDRKVP